MRIYFVRHGVTEWNSAGRVQGHTDIPLSDEGRFQAWKVACYIDKIKPDVIYSSPLKRALETAQIITRYSMPIIRLPGLAERSYGALEGMTRQQFMEVMPDIEARRKAEGIDFMPPGGESGRAMMKRVLDEFNGVLKRHREGQKVLIVSHGGAHRVIITSVKGLDCCKMYDHPAIRNCALTCISCEDGKISVEFEDKQADELMQ